MKLEIFVFLILRLLEYLQMACSYSLLWITFLCLFRGDWSTAIVIYFGFLFLRYLELGFISLETIDRINLLNKIHLIPFLLAYLFLIAALLQFARTEYDRCLLDMVISGAFYWLGIELKRTDLFDFFI